MDTGFCMVDCFISDVYSRQKYGAATNNLLIAPTFELYMEEDKLIAQTASLVNGSFDLAVGHKYGNEEELILILAEKIGEMLERQPEQLMSLLYRLDVLEEKIRPVMRPDAHEPVNVGLARLVVERQKQRIATKSSIKTEPLEGLDGWEW
jgi:hypothetical protein